MSICFHDSSFFGFLNLALGADLETKESLWREATSLYTLGSEDFVSTLSETLNELKFLKQKVLHDLFEEKVSRLEIILSKSNNEVLSELEKYVKVNGIESLDDTLMMRLAQLHYDRANFDLTENMHRYEGELDQYRMGKIKEAPIPPMPDYRKAIFYTTQLIHLFPNSPLDDRAHYLLGYCLGEAGNGSESAKVFNELPAEPSLL